MSIEANKATMRLFFQEVVSKGNLEVLDRIAAADFCYHDGPTFVPNVEEWKQLLMEYRRSLPDLNAAIEDMIGEGDKVASRITFTGTHKGEMMGIPPTDKRVIFTLTMVSRFSGDKVSELWINWDALGLLQQLGGTSAPGQGAT